MNLRKLLKLTYTLNQLQIKYNHKHSLLMIIEIALNVVTNAIRILDLTMLNSQLHQEITERKQAEMALRDSEERFQLLIENVHDYSIYLLDPDGQVAT